MTTSTTIQPKSSNLYEEVQYLPFKAFIGHMERAETNIPYASTFSFQPFIEKMKANRGLTNQEVKDPFLLDVEQNIASLMAAQDQDNFEKKQAVISTLFPALFYEGQIGFVAKPFNKEFFYITPALQEVFESEDWEVKITGKLKEAKMGSPAIEAGKLILNTLYGQEFESKVYQTMSFRHKETLCERYFKVNIIFDYIKTSSLKPLPELDEEKMHQLFNEWENETYWLQQFPPDDFIFEGLIIGYIQEVTEQEVLSAMKEMMIAGPDEERPEDAELIRIKLNNMVRSFLQMPDVTFGNLLKRDFKYAELVSWSVIGDLETLHRFNKEEFVQNPTYGKVISTEKALIISDLKEIENPSRIELHLLEKGFRSLLLVPQKDKDGQVIGVIELASLQAYRFNKQLLAKVEPVLSLYLIGANRWIQEVDNSVNFFIQQQFTYIHPSVQWKFQEVSQKFLFETRTKDDIPVLEPIVFKNVYPLYGQADIVGSSEIRNRSIEADMLDNLQRVQAVMKAFRAQLEFQLLDVYQAKTEAFIQRLENGGYVSSDESQIVELLAKDIHPLLRELSQQFAQLPKDLLTAYFDYLDPVLDLVYRQRKNYEESVLLLNSQIANYIEAEVAKKQEVLPHFFEKYVTDGVEYNMYLGQSLLSEGKFSHYFLEDFRLWQLLLMCNVTRLVEEQKNKLPVSLSTAQLIFVYYNALSIRFKMDEKQFDVDGAYNVRYEILKKRIDKAIIKGTDERLTQKGKIAIVWLQEKDRNEYFEYLMHLLDQGYITNDIEELELEPLQGAAGLKALRVTVVV